MKEIQEVKEVQEPKIAEQELQPTEADLDNFGKVADNKDEINPEDIIPDTHDEQRSNGDLELSYSVGNDEPKTSN